MCSLSSKYSLGTILRSICVVVCFAAVTQAGAQGFSVEAGGGLQGMHYTLSNGKSQPQPGGSLGLGYSFRLSSNVDLLTGVSGGIYRTKATLKDGVISSSYQVDDMGSAFQYNVRATGYQETQKFFAASVPILLQYHTTGEGLQWYFDGGGKVFAPFGSNVNGSARQLVLSGYYPDFNIDVSNLPQHGFGTVNGWKSTATAKLKAGAALSAATGVSFGLSGGTRLYAGLFVDYGLTAITQKGDSLPLVAYSSGGLNTAKAGSILNMHGTGSAKLFSLGLQVRISFATGRSKPATPETKGNQEPPPVRDTLGDEQLEVIEGSVVFGLLGETVVPEIQKKHLDEVAAIMKQFPAIRISLVGHTCDGESEPEEKRVGVDRAKSVASYLRSKGIDPSRMEVSPTSESDVFEPFNPLANFRSRRVVVKVK
jgi:outer membrane protein OmpA-like peptidoglycan-associated protein